MTHSRRVKCIDRLFRFRRYTLRLIQTRELGKHGQTTVSARVSREEKVSCSLSETVTNVFKEVKSGCLLPDIWTAPDKFRHLRD